MSEKDYLEGAKTHLDTGEHRLDAEYYKTASIRAQLAQAAATIATAHDTRRLADAAERRNELLASQSVPLEGLLDKVAEGEQASIDQLVRDGYDRDDATMIVDTNFACVVEFLKRHGWYKEVCYIGEEDPLPDCTCGAGDVYAWDHTGDCPRYEEKPTGETVCICSAGKDADPLDHITTCDYYPPF
jgi:hypothetical protein